MLVFATTLAVGSAAVLAQNKPEQGAGQLEEVVVTAERREASLQTVPIPVTALTTESLENHQVTAAADLQRYVPSLRMSNNITSPTNLSPSLRGSLQQDASLIVAESPFGIYVDDVYVGRLNGNNITLADIERVEVLRGPQGTLYGRNTLAGAIKFVSRTPGKTSWLDAKVGGGDHGQYLASLSAGGPLSDSWAGSFSAQDSHKDGESSNRLTHQSRGMEESWAARGKLHYMGMENFDAVFSVSYADSKNDANQMIPFTTPGVASNRQFTSDDLVPTFGLRDVSTPDVVHSPSIITNQPSGRTKQTIASANISYDFGGVTLRSITGYVKTKDFFSTDFSGVGTIIGASTVDNNEFTEELQVQGKAMNDKLSYLAGAYYLQEKGDQDFGWVFFTPTSTSQQHAKTDSISIFGQADYHFTDALKATAGEHRVSATPNVPPAGTCNGRGGTEEHLFGSDAQIWPRLHGDRGRLQQPAVLRVGSARIQIWRLLRHRNIQLVRLAQCLRTGVQLDL
jgi:iron complex outermembrane receptor protein